MKLLDRYFIGLNNKGNLIFTDVVTDEVSSLFVEAYKKHTLFAHGLDLVPSFIFLV